MSKIQPTQKRCLTLDEAADYLSISVRSLYTLRSLGEIPFIQIGRSIRFEVDALDAYIDRHRITKTVPQPRITTRHSHPTMMA